MCVLEKRRKGPFIGNKKEANPLHNRCGMWDLHFLQKNNIMIGGVQPHKDNERVLNNIKIRRGGFQPHKDNERV